MSEHEPGPAPASSAAPVPTAPTAPLPAQRRGDDHLLAFFTPERAAALSLGRGAVAAACGTVFPPRPDDPRGALLPADLQQEANSRIALAVRSTTARHRVWVLEGVAVGFAEQAVSALAGRGHHDPAGLLRARSVARPASTRAERAAVEAFLAVVQACAEQDPVAAAWAVECLWLPGRGEEHLPADAPERGQQVRTVLSVAASACTACLDLVLNG